MSTSWDRAPGPAGFGVLIRDWQSPVVSGMPGRQSQIRHGELGVLPVIVGGRFVPATTLTSDYNQGDRKHPAVNWK